MIRIEGLGFAIGDFALRDISLDVAGGEYFVLLGKPGSGKTLLLECIAGLHRIGAGAIQVGDRRVDRLEPGARGIGYVPQDYALFSRLRVRGNIAFALRVRRSERTERAARVAELAGLLGIGHLLDRSVAGLSGGERQRVALARALAARPSVLLLDEPVSALDPETRERVLLELRAIQRETGTTTIHVCHDLDEMRSVADRVAILDRGRLLQTGAPEEIRRAPATPAIARLFRLGSIILRDGIETLIRSDAVEIRPAGQTGLPAVVTRILWREATAWVDLRLGDDSIRAEVPRLVARGLAPGASVRVKIPPEAAYPFPHEASRATLGH
ncbi:MAG: ABC transporter ATP-binding protein [Planctomycetes bacterium]|nr:ABC transporter ATP-binding protein [Planctomycetota bacterium]